MKKYLLACCMLLATAVSVSCDDDGDATLFDHLVGRVWIGDLGMTDRWNNPLESAVYLGSDGFGSDDLRYYDNGEPFGVYNIQWDAYNGSLFISYGNMAPPRELHNVSLRRGALFGTLYVDGFYYGPVTLYMD